jgi:CheY-like chemotaxis protein
MLKKKLQICFTKRKRSKIEAIYDSMFKNLSDTPTKEEFRLVIQNSKYCNQVFSTEEIDELFEHILEKGNSFKMNFVTIARGELPKYRQFVIQFVLTNLKLTTDFITFQDIVKFFESSMLPQIRSITAVKAAFDNITQLLSYKITDNANSLNNQLNCLIISDSSAFSSSVSKIFNRAKYRTEVSTIGKKAVLLMMESIYSSIFIDLHSVDIDLEWLRKFRETESEQLKIKKQIIFGIFDGSNDKSIKKKAYENGIDIVMTKESILPKFIDNLERVFFTKIDLM